MLNKVHPIPNEWVPRKLRYFVEQGMIELGRGNIISHNDMAESPGNYPVYSSSAAREGKIGAYGKYMFDEELISWSIDGGGRFFYRPKHRFSVTNVSGYLRLWTDELDYRWLHYLLDLQQQHLTFDYTYKAHPSVIIDRYEVYDVPLAEQRRIAEILATADEAIRQTERVIAKLREVKRGLLHDLLTRGLDAAGNLRDPIAHPEQFKDSSLGRIPREWSVEEGSDITELITKGASPRWQGFEYQPEGVLFVTSENVREGYLDVSDPKFISDEFDRKLQRSHLEAGDVLVNLVGASIGRSCIYSGQFGSANINQAVCTFRTKPGVLPNWILSYLQMPETISRLLEDQVETARANISLGQLGEFLFPLPSLSEQHRVAAILDTHEARIRAEEAVLAKQHQVKRGLMEDLLTGRVRV